jgi:hypothetical protein
VVSGTYKEDLSSEEMQERVRIFFSKETAGRFSTGQSAK